MDFTTEKFSYVKKGYNPEEVDRYIDTLESVIKSYKEKDNAIKNAIISAQIAADNVVKNAHIQADETKARSIRQLNYILESITTQRKMVKEFQDDFNAMTKKYFDSFNENDIAQVNGKIDDLEAYLSKLKHSDDELAAAADQPEAQAITHEDDSGYGHDEGQNALRAMLSS